MKGKKIDSEFVTSFIENCVNNNLFSTEDILNAAKSQISLIDEKIKEVEILKKNRSKLLDVVLTFENKTTTKDPKDYKVLQLFNIKNKNVCKNICDLIKNSPVEIDLVLKLKHPVVDINFAVKQLLEHKVISKVGNHIIQGDMYETYMNNVACENR